MKKTLLAISAILLSLSVLLGSVYAQDKSVRHPRKKINIPNIQIQQSQAIDPNSFGPPDLTVTDFRICKRHDQNSSATFSLTFKNIGQGPSVCFDWVLYDSKGGAKAQSICPSGPANWRLQAGEEKTVTGLIRKSDVWSYPVKRGYVSHVTVRVNKGSKEAKVNETTEANNVSQEMDIYWDATGVQNHQCTPFQ